MLKKGDKLTEKEQEVEQFEGKIAEDEAVYGEMPNKAYSEQELQQLKADLLELYRMAGLFDQAFK